MAVLNVSCFAAFESRDLLGIVHDAPERIGVELLSGEWCCRWLVDPAGAVTTKAPHGRAVVRR